MITALIAPPPSKTKRPRNTPPMFVPPGEIDPDELSPRRKSKTRSTILPTSETIQRSRTDDYNEERDILLLVSMMLLVLVVPAVLMLTYLSRARATQVLNRLKSASASKNPRPDNSEADVA